MTGPRDRRVAISLRMYRAMARAFPHEFKNAYGEELMQATEDAIEPIWRRHGVFGLVRLLVDVAVRVPAEYLAELRQDVRYGLRMLAGSPGFTAVALISLGLGIAAATSFFSELNGTILRNVLAVSQPDELVTLRRRYRIPATGAIATGATCSPRRSLKLRRCRSALRSTGARNGPGGTWSRPRTSPRWVSARPSDACSLKSTSSPAQRRPWWSVTGSGRATWDPTRR